MLTVRKVQTQEEFKSALDIRVTVFVKEQNCSPDIEPDEFDDAADHWLMINQADGAELPVGTIRLVRDTPTEGRLGRMAVLKEARGKGCGRKLIQAMEDFATKVGAKRITLHGQVSAKKFYESCGYHQCSDEVFIEENIEHVHMAKDLDPSPHNREVQFLSRL